MKVPPRNSLSRSAYCTYIALLFTMAVWTPARGDESSKLLVDAIEASANSITSFDIYATVVRTVIVRYSAVEENGRRGREVGTLLGKPSTSKMLTRQVYSTGRRRIEQLNPQTNAVSMVVASDGQVERVWHPTRLEAMIRRPGRPVFNGGFDYQESYRSFTGPISIPLIFREREKNIRVRKSEGNGRYHVIEADPAPGHGFTMGNRGLRLFADSLENLLPATIETYRVVNGEPVVVTRKKVMERKKIADGINAPTRVLTEYYSPAKDDQYYKQLIAMAELKVDLSRSRWNVPIDNSAFTIPIPAGAKVVDTIRNITFVTGKPDPGKALDDLATGARGLITNTRQPPMPAPWAWYWWVIGLVAAAGVIVVTYLCSRRLIGRSSP